MKKILLIFAGMLCLAHFAYANVTLSFWDFTGCFFYNEVPNEAVAPIIGAMTNGQVSLPSDAGDEALYVLPHMYELGYEEDEGQNYVNEDMFGFNGYGFYVSHEPSGAYVVNIVYPYGMTYCGTNGVDGGTNWCTHALEVLGSGADMSAGERGPMRQIYCKNGGHWSASQRTCVKCSDQNCWNCPSSNSICTVCRPGMMPNGSGQCKYYYHYKISDGASTRYGLVDMPDQYNSTKAHQFRSSKESALRSAGFTYPDCRFDRTLIGAFGDMPEFTVTCHISDFTSMNRCKDYKNVSGQTSKACVPSGRTLEGNPTYVITASCPAGKIIYDGECQYDFGFSIRDKATTNLNTREATYSLNEDYSNLVAIGGGARRPNLTGENSVQEFAEWMASDIRANYDDIPYIINETNGDIYFDFSNWSAYLADLEPAYVGPFIGQNRCEEYRDSHGGGAGVCIGGVHLSGDSINNTPVTSEDLYAYPAGCSGGLEYVDGQCQYPVNVYIKDMNTRNASVEGERGLYYVTTVYRPNWTGSNPSYSVSAYASSLEGYTGVQSATYQQGGISAYNIIVDISGNAPSAGVGWIAQRGFFANADRCQDFLENGLPENWSTLNSCSPNYATIFNGVRIAMMVSTVNTIGYTRTSCPEGLSLTNEGCCCVYTKK